MSDIRPKENNKYGQLRTKLLSLAKKGEKVEDLTLNGLELFVVSHWCIYISRQFIENLKDV